MANKQSSSGTTKPGCSFCLPPDSHLCFILVAELKQRAAGDPLPTATTSWGNSPLTEGFPSFGILIAGAFPSHQGGLSLPKQTKFFKNSCLGSSTTCFHSAAIPCAAGDVSVTLSPSSDTIFWRGISHPQGCGSGWISSEPGPSALVTSKKHSPKAAMEGLRPWHGCNIFSRLWKSHVPAMSPAPFGCHRVI